MATVRGPLYSFEARGTVYNSITFRQYELGPTRRSVANFKDFSKKVFGAAQSEKEKGIRECQSVWRSLTDPEKDDWELVAYDRHPAYGERIWQPDLSGYHKFMSYGMRAYLAGEPIPRTVENLGEGTFS